jgi:hypothetical protein
MLFMLFSLIWPTKAKHRPARGATSLLNGAQHSLLNTDMVAQQNGV